MYDFVFARFEGRRDRESRPCQEEKLAEWLASQGSTVMLGWSPLAREMGIEDPKICDNELYAWMDKINNIITCTKVKENE